MESFGLLSGSDRSLAVQVLRRRLDVSDIRAALADIDDPGRGRKSVERIVAELDSPSRRGTVRLPDAQITEFLVDRAGFGLLESRVLRERLALKASPDELDLLHSYSDGQKARGGRREKAKAVAKRTWRPGRAWPRHFVKVLDLPPVYAGLPGEPREADSLEVAPFVPLGELEDFQDELVLEMQDILSGSPGANRGVLTLPTGAGKTRTAVEGLIKWRLTLDHRNVIVWIAQSEELCEQAVQAFREVWTDLGHRSEQVRATLKIARFWGDAEVPEDPDVIVASIQKLHAAVRDEEESLTAVRERLGAVVVDEAHRMEAPTYRQVLTYLGVFVHHRGVSPVPLLGLTATPFRRDDDETRQLVNRFHGRLLVPTKLGNDMIGELRRRQVLSEPQHEVLSHAGPAFDMGSNQRYVDHFQQFKDFHPGFLQQIGQSEDRNRALVRRLLELPTDWPTLFFGCTVEHAVAIALLLRRNGRTAEAVTAETRTATRRALIERFRAGEISVLCNYGVLTTGFDAPRVRALVVGRPTTSRVLYEQMIGRGMRGPRFGGTASCQVIDIQDNIRFRGELAFTHYTSYWTGSRRNL
ncbi:DEAD/DEAH box helicase [Luedemannella helvata]|uniref:DEAD/DEAH box helicase n=1 Tax=Luedemannella helvata TaxID=349315 RepID=A0ABN2L5D0_9ACTN